MVTNATLEHRVNKNDRAAEICTPVKACIMLRAEQLLDTRCRSKGRRDVKFVILLFAGGDVSQLTGIDGLDMWDAISQDLPSPRTRLLVNIDDHSGYSALRFGRYKYVNGKS